MGCTVVIPQMPITIVFFPVQQHAEKKKTKKPTITTTTTKNNQPNKKTFSNNRLILVICFLKPPTNSSKSQQFPHRLLLNIYIINCQVLPVQRSVSSVHKSLTTKLSACQNSADIPLAAAFCTLCLIFNDYCQTP